MRAALLPTPGDPFLARYWVKNFTEVWRNEVDELLVLVNGQNSDRIRGYLTDLFTNAGGRKLTLLFHNDRLDHGVGLGMLLDQTEADTILLCEDDAWVRRPHEIHARFDLVERGDCDVIGSPRGCASQELIERAWARWPANASVGSDAGHGLWPCFFFAKRDHLLATDRHFGARNWDTGDTVAGIDHVASAPLSADTLVSTCYQLRDAGLRIRLEPQYRVTDAGFMPSWLAESPPWFHVGSLSSGYGMAFDDSAGGSLLLSTWPEDARADADQLREWSRRIYWWERVAATADAELPDELAHYREQVAQLIERTGTRELVNGWAHLMGPWVSWDDS